MTTRPNLLFVFTDQQCADAMSCAGDRWMKTPAMDRLAAEGVRFTKAYCTFPLCTPSRLSLLTGRLPHDVRCSGNAIEIPDHVREQSLGNLLLRAGYDCGYAGKWHLPRANIGEGFGFSKAADFHDAPTLAGSLEFLAQKRDRPFALIASFHNPHDICEWARGQNLPEGPIEDAPPEECPPLPMNFAPPRDMPEALLAERAFNTKVHPTSGWPISQWRRYQHAYRRLVEKVDAQIGQLLNALDSLGLARDTAVFFSSDHGDGLGSHGWNQKSSLYDGPTRVPMIARWPGVFPRGKIDTDHLVSNGLDLLPTFCELAGIQSPDGLRGRSLCPLLQNATPPAAWRGQVEVQTCFTEPAYRGTVGRMIRTPRFKYVLYSWGEHREQLFDMESDPLEVRNLAREASHADTLAEHRQRLGRYLAETGDTFSITT